VSATDADGTVVDISITNVSPSPAPGSITLGGLVPASGPGGTATATVTVDAAVPAGVYSVLVTATNDDPTPQTGTCTLAVSVTSAARIHDIQDGAHLSPFAGVPVTDVPGIVTALRSNGFYFQDPDPDADDATSEGLFVFTSVAPSVVVGDAVQVDGTVSEFRPGGATSANLTTTELVSPTVTVLSTGNATPAPAVVGTGGRIPPDEVIEDDATGDVETSGVFDPATDGIDFYESLEGMLVQVNDAVAVGPTNAFGEIAVVGDDGANASVRTARGGVVVRPDDFNPERIHLDNEIAPTPLVQVGDHLSSPVVGVLDYSFGNFKLQVTTSPTAISGGLARESATAAGAGELSVASFNVENLDPGDGARIDELATEIVDHLRSPDLIGVQEVQDNNGPTNDAVVDASQSFAALIDAISAAGGPTYDFRAIDPVDDEDGGEPGGNIRVGFLFRTDRGLAFVDRPGGTSTAGTSVVAGSDGPELTFSPGRIDPTNAAFADSRKPLAGEFTFMGRHLFVVVNHLNSKGGDDPLFGHLQPPTLVSEVQRIQQAQVVNDFVDSVLSLDADADVIVLGDLNDFEFSTPLSTLTGGVLTDLVTTLPQDDRYTYVFEGNSQTLDHILVSDPLAGVLSSFDVVHMNAEFAV
jgi:predicted extracellular nuclease